jgi:hypothetical protein
MISLYYYYRMRFLYRERQNVASERERVVPMTPVNEERTIPFFEVSMQIISYVFSPILVFFFCLFSLLLLLTNIINVIKSCLFL